METALTPKWWMKWQMYIDVCAHMYVGKAGSGKLLFKFHTWSCVYITQERGLGNACV